jgi:ribose 1,5-bisphosphokinase PhnN
LIAKDPLKERLHDGLGGEGRDWSRRLGVASFEVLFLVLEELLGNGVAVVAEGNFARAEPFRSLPDARVLQVHVSASPDVLRKRFANRQRRHAVHYDAEVVDEVPTRVAAGEWEPLDIGGRLLQVDTSVFPNVVEVASEVAALSRS